MGQGVYCGLEVEGNMIAREPFLIMSPFNYVSFLLRRGDDDDDMTLNAMVMSQSPF